jgi:hypothetical protein
MTTPKTKDERDSELVILETIDRYGATVSRVTMTHKQAYDLIWEQRGHPDIGGWTVRTADPEPNLPHDDEHGQA